jgi:diguanylate cyclase (GGDEF)-like protein
MKPNVRETFVTRLSDSFLRNLPQDGQMDKNCCLVCIHPAERLGKVFKLEAGEVLVGRDPDCQLELTDDSVSRRHALLRGTEEGFVVIDLGSTNGTYVNDTRIDMVALQPGDRLRFGNQIFKYLSTDRFEAEYFDHAYRMITTDGLTQVCNKRYLIDVAERELRRTLRTGRALSLLMIDADHFKLINDSLGHLTGDEVLIELSRRLQASLRGDEVLARYGGEEFCVLMPDTALLAAIQAGDRLRRVVADQDFVTERARVPVTVSIGVASSEGHKPISLSQLLELADKQLYAAKTAGRDRVVG